MSTWKYTVMAEKFRMVTDELFAKLGAGALAGEMGVSTQAIKQARMEKGSAGYRPPPAGWEKSAVKLIDRRISQLARLKVRLTQD